MTSAPSSPIPLNRRRLIAAGAAGLAALAPAAAWALDRPKLSRQANHALSQLYANDSTARALGAQALAVLVFPEITKAGFIVGGENGDGVLYLGRSVAGFYSITAGSIGLQAGAQKYGYALFFMNQKALDYLRRSDGWSIGTGPTVVIVDKGFAKNFNTTTARKDVYAVAFDQKGLMAGLGLQGSKIAPIH